MTRRPRIPLITASFAAGIALAALWLFIAPGTQDAANEVPIGTSPAPAVEQVQDSRGYSPRAEQQLPTPIEPQAASGDLPAAAADRASDRVPATSVSAPDPLAPIRPELSDTTAAFPSPPPPDPIRPRISDPDVIPDSGPPPLDPIRPEISIPADDR